MPDAVRAVSLSLVLALAATAASLGLSPIAAHASQHTAAQTGGASPDGAGDDGADAGDDPTGDARPSRSLGDRVPLRRGMTGHDVKVLQDFLGRAGLKSVAIDGQFGPGTVRAVRTFERQQKLPVDGVVDANDIDVLRGQVAAGPAASTAPQPLPLAPGNRATLDASGLAQAPAAAPDQVKQIIAAANEIADKPYVYGGGHGRWQDRGYDCSGSVSYALHGAGLLDTPLVSGDFPGWGDPGPGQWVTLYGNTGHGYMVVAGLRFDTSGAKKTGSRWQTQTRPTKGYGASHPTGL